MVTVRYSRYEENRQTYQDKHILTPEGKVRYLCRECETVVPRGRLRHYCSQEHKDKWERENVPNGWGEMKARILKRDGHRCTNCGITEADLMKKAAAVRKRFEGVNMARKAARLWETYRLEVDHIKPVKLYPELEYEESNLRTLCHRCHARIGKRPRKGVRPRVETNQARLL